MNKNFLQNYKKTQIYKYFFFYNLQIEISDNNQCNKF